MAAADDALKAILGAVRKTVDIGDVARPFNPARLDAVSRMLPVAAEDVVKPRLTLGEGLTKWGFTPKEGDWDAEDYADALGDWGDDERDQIVGELMQETIDEDQNQFILDSTRELLDNYFPDYEQYPRGAYEARNVIEDAFKQFGDNEDIPYADAKDFTDWLDIELQNRRDRFFDNVEYGDYHDAADQTYEAQRAYQAFDDIVARIEELPDNHPFRKAISAYPDYWMDGDAVWGLVSDLTELQRLGVNRDIIADVQGSRLKPLLSSRWGEGYDSDMRDYIVPKQVAETLTGLGAPTAGAYARALESTDLNPYTILKTLTEEPDPAVRDTFLGLLPEWDGSLEEALDTARLLAE